MLMREILDSVKNIAIAVLVALVIVRYIGQTAIVKPVLHANDLVSE